MDTFRKAIFSMDPIEGTYPGFTKDDDWNGWACPYFEFDEATKILDASRKNGFTWTYNEKEDSFLIQDTSQDDDYIVNPVMIEVNGQAVKTYPVGAYNWI